MPLPVGGGPEMSHTDTADECSHWERHKRINDDLEHSQQNQAPATRKSMHAAMPQGCVVFLFVVVLVFCFLVIASVHSVFSCAP